MILERVYEDRLAQASHLIGCGATREALVVDPTRDIARYRRLAERRRLRITHVTETHIHADFLSGSRELAEATGARLYLSGEGASRGAADGGAGGADWRYGFADDANATLIGDGDGFQVGNIRIDVVHTPGHTPEHLTFLVTAGAEADAPIGALTGDFVFVGDVGRPDLLEKAAGESGAAESAARDLFRSLERFRERPEWLQIWPGHGAGSACGKSMSAVPHSTLGYEKRFNWAFSYDDEDAFVRAVLEGQPEPPKYFAVMKRLNRDGPPPLGGIMRPGRVGDSRLAKLLDSGELVVDIRAATAYADNHAPGSINIPLNRSFPTWAGWLLPYDRDLYVIAEENVVDEAIRELSLIGLDRLAGWFTPGAIDAVDSVDAGYAVDAVAGDGGDREAAAAPGIGRESRVNRMGVDEMAERVAAGDVTILDVRWDDEWNAGHLPNGTESGGAPVLHIPLGYLTDRLDEVPRDRPVVVHCQSGSRSAIAASILERHGFEDVIDFTGGYGAWRAAVHAAES